MKRIVLSTSSSGLDNFDIPNNIEMIRLHLEINGVDFIDGKNINIERLHYLMDDLSSGPIKTAPASENEVFNKLSNLQTEGYRDIFITTLSSQMSDSYYIISKVAKSFEDKLNIYVYDCKDLNTCEAMLALEADYMLQRGMTFSDIAQQLNKLRQNHSMLFAVNDLSYLIKNKQLPMKSSFVANFLDIKPVLQVSNNGEVALVNKIRNIDKTLDFMIEYLAPSIKKNTSFPYILSGGDKDLNDYFINMVKHKLNIKKIPVFTASSVSIANHGPSAVGLCVFQNHIPQLASFYL